MSDSLRRALDEWNEERIPRCLAEIAVREYRDVWYVYCREEGGVDLAGPFRSERDALLSANAICEAASEVYAVEVYGEWSTKE